MFLQSTLQLIAIEGNSRNVARLGGTILKVQNSR